MDTKIRKIFVLLYPLNDFSKRMYEYIQGKLAELAPAYAVVETGGVGYLLHISLQTYSEIEGRSEVKLFTHFVVREDAQLFFGFSTKTERELFRQLISVSGVGGNTARMILSTYSPRELQSIITTENAVLLKNVKGLGLKTAQKIIVELSGKLTALFDGDAACRSNGSEFAATSRNTHNIIIIYIIIMATFLFIMIVLALLALVVTLVVFTLSQRKKARLQNPHDSYHGRYRA